VEQDIMAAVLAYLAQDLVVPLLQVLLVQLVQQVTQEAAALVAHMAAAAMVIQLARPVL
jgi:hypothetical protein